MFPTKLDVNMIIFMPRKIHKQLLKNLSRNAKRAHFKVLHPKSRRTLISKLWNMQTNWVYTFWHLGKNEYYFLFFEFIFFTNQANHWVSYCVRKTGRRRLLIVKWSSVTFIKYSIGKYIINYSALLISRIVSCPVPTHNFLCSGNKTRDIFSCLRDYFWSH